MIQPRRRVPAILLLLAALPLTAAAEPARIALIIDDLGHGRVLGLRATALPGAVAVAILPHTAHGAALAQDAQLRGKEILLHVPMAALAADQVPGPGQLTLEQTRAEFAATFALDLAAVPFVRGVSNHMGSLVTSDASRMQWLMAELVKLRPLFFIDSFTTHHSVGLAAARAHAVPALKRDVFLDGDPTPQGVEREWTRLLELARQRGFAVGIGHPYSGTLDWLERRLPALDPADVQLVTLATLLKAKGGQNAAPGEPSRHEP